jgi:predicted GNAT family N-acyltransferase
MTEKCVSKPDIRVVRFASPAYHEMVALRSRLLREPLGLAFTAEQLAAEKDHVHLAAWKDGVMAGTLMLLPPDPNTVARMRQMAVDPRFERRGLGRALVHCGEIELCRLGATRIELAARVPAVGFYEKLGYEVQGEPFIELTVPHVLMAKRLQGPMRRSGAAS